MPFDNVPTKINEEVCDDLDKLKAARDLISRGWCQNAIRQPVFEPTNLYGIFRAPEYAYCMMGALMEACLLIAPNAPMAANMQTCRIVEQYIYPEIAGWGTYKSPPIRTVERYNDYVGRKKEEVIEVFNRAIARAMRAQ